MKVLCALTLFALAVAGCSSDDSKNDPGESPAVEGKDVFSGGGYKADCLDCDPGGASAFVQLGLGDRFWQVGDAWQVAYLLRSDKRVQRAAFQTMEDIENHLADVGVTVLDFTVIANGTALVAGKKRVTATIRISQGEAIGGVRGAIGDQEIRVDQLTRQVDIVLDDLLRPLSITEYSGPKGAFPNGRMVQTDPREALRSLDSSFPYIVPNAYLDAEKGELPKMPLAIAAIGEKAPLSPPEHVFIYDMVGRGTASSETVYWAEGQPWPYYVETASAVGLLISANF